MWPHCAVRDMPVLRPPPPCRPPRAAMARPRTPPFNLSPGRLALLLHMHDGKLQSDHLTSGYRTANEAQPSGSRGLMHVLRKR